MITNFVKINSAIKIYTDTELAEPIAKSRKKMQKIGSKTGTHNASRRAGSDGELLVSLVFFVQKIYSIPQNKTKLPICNLTLSNQIERE